MKTGAQLWRESVECRAMCERMVMPYRDRLSQSDFNLVVSRLFNQFWHELPAQVWQQMAGKGHEDCGPLCPTCGDPRDTSVAVAR